VPQAEYQFHGLNWGTDDCRLNENTTVSDVPFGMPGFDLYSIAAVSTFQNNLGLSTESTLITLLKQAAIIGSRTWSLWWGLMGSVSNVQMDGGLVLGGYDRAKIEGNTEQNYTGSISSSHDLCLSGMTVTITGITLHFPNGTEPNLLDPELGSAPLVACLCPNCDYFMTLPNDPYFDRFESFIGTRSYDRATHLNAWTMLFYPEDQYQGDLSVELSSSISFRISNSQLVLPARFIDRDGKIEENTDASDLLLNSLEGASSNDMVNLGRYFFTGAHLFVDQDAETFTLWEAKATTDIDLVSVVHDDDCGTSSAAVGSASNPKTSADGSGSGNQTETSSSSDNGVNAAGIAGGVVGGFVALAIGAVVLFLIRRRRNGTSSPPREENMTFLSRLKPHEKESTSPQQTPPSWELDGHHSESYSHPRESRDPAELE
jgi:hypothetical protein